MKIILVLGGYGNFGKRIVENLSEISDIKILIAGRNLAKGRILSEQLKSQSNAILEPLAIDITQSSFASTLKKISPFLVIHTSGPFQGQNYTVPQACISAGAHYIDLADDRRFVCDISSLNERAKSQGVLIVSGASSVPGLSSAVVDHYQNQCAEIHSLDTAIMPGNKAERGEATIRGILSYTGHPIEVFRNSRWQQVYGWMNARKHDFGKELGKRWLANVDVPDLELFPKRYSVTERVTFQAGLELPILHLTMVGMAFLAKLRVIKNWSKFTKAVTFISHLFKYLGTDKGGMRVAINAIDGNGQSISIKWNLFAASGVGPYIPTFSAIIVAKKLINKEILLTGAQPCLGLFEMEDFYPYFENQGIIFREEVDG